MTHIQNAFPLSSGQMRQFSLAVILVELKNYKSRIKRRLFPQKKKKRTIMYMHKYIYINAAYKKRDGIV